MESRSRKSIPALLTAVTLFSIAPAEAQTKVRVEGGTFFPYNVPLPLSISQSGEADIHLTAHYASEPFAVPICWAWRISLWWGGRAWEFEAVHHKIYLEDPPPEIGKFQISHGVNLVTINRAWQLEDIVLHAGAGVVLAHPENTIRGRSLSEDGGIFGLGYFLAGPTLHGAIGRQSPLGSGFLVTAEAKLSAYFATVPVADGHADVYGLIVQLTLMMGWETRGE